MKRKVLAATVRISLYIKSSIVFVSSHWAHSFTVRKMLNRRLPSDTPRYRSIQLCVSDRFYHQCFQTLSISSGCILFIAISSYWIDYRYEQLYSHLCIIIALNSQCDLSSIVSNCVVDVLLFFSLCLNCWRCQRVIIEATTEIIT